MITYLHYLLLFSVKQVAVCIPNFVNVLADYNRNFQQKKIKIKLWKT